MTNLQNIQITVKFLESILDNENTPAKTRAAAVEDLQAATDEMIKEFDKENAATERLAESLKFKQVISSREIARIIKNSGVEETLTYEVKFELYIDSENVDVNLIIFNEDSRIIVDEMIATKEVSWFNEDTIIKKAEKMVSRLEAKFAINIIDSSKW